MTPERHQRICDLFNRARRLHGAERASMLAEACADDAALRREVESLLEHHAEATGFLPCPDAPERAESDAPVSVGRFRLLGRLGEGGMGVVYRAEQDRPRRTVALKMMRSAFPSPQARARFEREAELLGRLQHPNIAQVYEAGVAPDGGVYLAMELVEGIPIDEYVRRRAPDRAEICSLLEQVCDAVQHAHQRGVIHRDLKPPNILVDESSRVRVLDFGVARAVEQGATLGASIDHIIGTPRYMSPEQFSGDPHAVDARADVYALGVLAYLLLSGRHPVPEGVGGFAAVSAAVREREPERLGGLDRSLRGDIETIVSKAMEKDPRRRYQSAAEFSADIRRYMGDEPVLARPATTLYQLRKLARRRPGLAASVCVGAAGLLCVAIVSLGALAVSRQAATVREEALRVAQQETDRANRVLEFLQEMLASADPSQSGADARITDALHSAAAMIDDAFPDDPEAEASIRHTIGLAYNSVGLHDPARRHLRAALKLREARFTPSHPARVATLTALGAVAIDDRAWEEAAGVAERLLDAGAPRARVEGLRLLAIVHMGAGELDMAVRRARESLAAAEAALDPQEIGRHAVTLGQALLRAGRPREAAPQYARAVSLLTRSRGPEHDATLSARSSLAGLLREIGDPQRAERIYREVIETRLARFGPDHPSTLAVQNNLADMLSLQGRHDEAEPLLLRVRDGFERTRGADHESTIIATANLAASFHRRQRLDEAAALYQRVFDWQSRELGEGHPSTMNTMSNYARLLHRSGATERSADMYERLCRLAADALPEGHWRIAAYSVGYAMTLSELQRYDEAESRLLDGYETLSATLGPSHAYVLRTAEALAELYEAQGMFDQAAPWRARAERVQTPGIRNQEAGT